MDITERDDCRQRLERVVKIVGEEILSYQGEVQDVNGPLEHGHHTSTIDEFARRIYDPSHSSTEDRFLILGMSATIRILVVCHCYKEDDEVIRIISARKASKKEETQYYEKRI